MMYVGMIETRSLKILLKSFHENYSDLFKKTTRYTNKIKVNKECLYWYKNPLKVLGFRPVFYLDPSFHINELGNLATSTFLFVKPLIMFINLNCQGW